MTIALTGKKRKTEKRLIEGVFQVGTRYGSRTRVTAVRGRCPRPLDESSRLDNNIEESFFCQAFFS